MIAETIYPDTEVGAIEALKDMSVHNMEGSTAIPDPYVKGVWKVYLPNDNEFTAAIVYLAGYMEVVDKRKFNDFESIIE